jgi:ribosomal protein S12 methylthiotransferase accessory factor
MSTSPLIDARTGVIHHVRRDDPDPDMPRGWLSYSAHVSGHPEVLPWVVDRQGFGGALGRPEVARGAAIGEALERYAGNARTGERRVASRRELTAAGLEPAPRGLVPLYDDAQYATPGFPFARPDDDTRMTWIRGRSLADDRPVWIPAAFVDLNFYRDTGVDEAPLTSLIYAGIAAGRTEREALASAVAEAIERDAVTRWWQRRDPSSPVHGIDEVLARVRDPERATRTIVVHRLPSESGVPVCAAFVEDRRRRLVAFGTAARTSVAAAAEKAIVEALGLLLLTREVATEGSVLWRTVDAGLVPSTTFFPYREDRAYRRDAGDDWRHLNDLPALIQLYLDPAMQGAPLERLRTPTGPPADGREGLPTGPGEDDLDRYLAALAPTGAGVLAVDLTPEDVRRGGIHVARVLIEGHYGNAPAAFPHRGGRRLYDPRVPGGPRLTAADLETLPLLLA